MKIYIGDAN